MTAAIARDAVPNVRNRAQSNVYKSPGKRCTGGRGRDGASQARLRPRLYGR